MSCLSLLGPNQIIIVDALVSLLIADDLTRMT